VGPESVIDGPPQFAQPFGLIASATTVDHGDHEWMGGMRLTPESCQGIDMWAPCSSSQLTSGRNRAAIYSYDPFVGMVRDECGTWGWEAQDYEGRARRRLAAIESFGVEAEFWTGTLTAANPHLAAATATTLGTGLGLARGLALLVQGLATNLVGRGMIHARPYLVELWQAGGHLMERQGRLTTIGGHVVVPGGGYTGSSPAGVAPAGTLEYAYATDWIIVDRSPVQVFEGDMGEATDESNNIVAFRAQRGYGIRWNRCAHLAAQIDTAVA